MAAQETRWLIRSGGIITGPFNKSQIKQLIQEKEVLLHNEVGEPFGRWFMVQHHPQFAKVIEEIRQDEMGTDTSELTLTTSHDPFSQTMTLTSEKSFVDDLTERITPPPPPSAKEIVVDNVTETKSHSPKVSQARYQAQGRETDLVTDRNADDKTRWIWPLTFLIIVGAVAFMGYREYFQKPRDQSLKSTESLLLYKSDLEFGFFQEALHKLKKANVLETGAPEDRMWFALLLVRLEKQGVQARRILESIHFDSKETEAQRLMSLALVDMQEGLWRQAQMQLMKVMEAKSNFVEAFVNLSFVAEKLGDESMSRTYMERAMTSSPGESLIPFLTLMNRVRTNGNTSELGEFVENLLKSQSPFSQELYVLKAEQQMEKKDKVAAEENLTKALDSDPKLSGDIVLSPWIFSEVFDLGTFIRICESLNKEFQSANSGSLLATYYIKTGRYEAAKNLMSGVLELNPRDSLIWATQAFLYEQLSQPEQASLAIGKSSEFNNAKLYSYPIWLQAQFCLEAKDLECARARMLELVNREGFRMQAQVGLGDVSVLNKSLAEARNYLSESRALDKKYRPGLRLNASLGQGTQIGQNSQ